MLYRGSGILKSTVFLTYNSIPPTSIYYSMFRFPLPQKISEYRNITLRDELGYIWLCLRETVRIIYDTRLQSTERTPQKDSQ